MLLDPLDTLQQANARPSIPPDSPITLFEGIDPAELKRIHSQLLAEFLHRRFQSEVGLRTCRSAIGPGTGLIGLHYIATDIHVGTAIDAGEMESAKASKKIGVSSRIKYYSGL